MFGPTFKGIQAGDRVKFKSPNGKKIVKGKIVQEYKVRTALVNRLLLFEAHVVVNSGTFGQVVDDENYISHTTPKAKD